MLIFTVLCLHQNIICSFQKRPQGLHYTQMVYSTVQYRWYTVQYSTYGIQYSTVQYRWYTVQYSTVQMVYSTVQYSTAGIQYSAIFKVFENAKMEENLFFILDNMLETGKVKFRVQFSPWQV